MYLYRHIQLYRAQLTAAPCLKSLHFYSTWTLDCDWLRRGSWCRMLSIKRT